MNEKISDARARLLDDRVKTVQIENARLRKRVEELEALNARLVEDGERLAELVREYRLIMFIVAAIFFLLLNWMILRLK